MKKIQFFVHHNWEWVLSSALEEPRKYLADIVDHEVSISCVKSPLRSLCSSQGTKKFTYALFRVEILDEQLPPSLPLPDQSCTLIQAVWATSTAFTLLDSKDCLFRCLRENSCQSVMPPTRLLPWDISSVDAVDAAQEFPCLLKAPCGSGGFGLYFVHSPTDILTIANRHATKARNERGFIDRLLRDNDGRVPDWSLQQIVHSIKVFARRRCQVRAYIAVCNNHLYVYPNFEVRIPSWGERTVDELIETLEENPTVHEDDDGLNPVVRFEMECCEGTTARPYNRQRVKEETNRMMLSEVSEICGLGSQIDECVRRAMIAIQPAILRQLQLDEMEFGDAAPYSRMAVAGIDLMIREDPETAQLTPLIVELNNNPAMPGKNKLMSQLYREHLIDLVGNLLSLSFTPSSSLFQIVW